MIELIENIEWKPITSQTGSPSGSLSLTFGCIGEGKPIATIIAGLHGDEGPWGAWAISKFLKNVDEDRVIGTIQIIPQANPLAMETDSRVAPYDHLDLGREFPGDSQGSHTQRIAHIISTNVLDSADYVIDLHGGGDWCVNAFAFRFRHSEDLAEAFDSPFIFDAQPRTGSLTNYALNQGSKVTAIEMGGRCKNEEWWAEHIAIGLERCLGVAGVIKPRELPRKYETLHIESYQILRPQTGGLLIPELNESSIGTVVEKGAVLGRIVDPATMVIKEVFEAPYNETALLLLRPRMIVLVEGAMTYIVAPIKKD